MRYISPRAGRVRQRGWPRPVCSPHPRLARHIHQRVQRDKYLRRFWRRASGRFLRCQINCACCYFSEFLWRSSKVDGLVACARLLGDPFVGAGVEKIERESSAVEHFVMELADVELGAEFLLRAVA